MSRNGMNELLTRDGCGPVKFTGTDDALCERRQMFDHVIGPKAAGPREQFEALASALRDVLAQRWIQTNDSYDRANPKQVYYLSMEFMIGRSLMNNVTNLLLAPMTGSFENAKGLELAEVIEREPDAGLGKGGLGRLAIVGTHSTNGVAAIHSELLRTKTVPDFAEVFPERYVGGCSLPTPICRTSSPMRSKIARVRLQSRV